MKLLLDMDELPNAQSAVTRRKMPRPQFSLRGLLIVITLIAVLLAATRLVPRGSWPLVAALACVMVGFLSPLVVPAWLPVGEGKKRQRTLALAVVLILLGMASTYAGGIWLLTILLDFGPPG